MRNKGDELELILHMSIEIMDNKDRSLLIGTLHQQSSDAGEMLL